MKAITLCHRCLRRYVRFTDPFLNSPEKEEDLLARFARGEMRPPSLVEDHGAYLIFNGNHRVLLAITRHLTIECTVLESVEDVLQSQILEAPRDRDLSAIVPLTFQGVIAALKASAAIHGDQDPDVYSFADM